jgi:hypothetical protein
VTRITRRRDGWTYRADVGLCFQEVAFGRVPSTFYCDGSEGQRYPQFPSRQGLEIVGSEASLLCNAREHFRAYFVAVVKSPGMSVIIIAVTQLNVRTSLMDRLPSDFYERLVYAAGPSTGPVAHAIARCRKLMELGISSCDFSTSSATARNAIAYALLMASRSVMPYAIAPGTSGTSAIQRPSSSRSVSMLNRKSWLLTPHGSLRLSVTRIGCPTIAFVACDRGHWQFQNGTEKHNPVCAAYTSKLSRFRHAVVNSLYSRFSD